MARLALLQFDQPTSTLHAARTTIAAVVSLLVARALKMPEPYWATVTTMVVMQSTLGAAWKVSATRFAGTALGAVIVSGCLPLPYSARDSSVPLCASTEPPIASPASRWPS